MIDTQANEARSTVSIRYRSGTLNEIVQKYAAFLRVILCVKSQDMVDCVRSFC
jgi:hypothetical protein